MAAEREAERSSAGNMRSALMALLLCPVVVAGASSLADAQPYCALYNDGAKSCGIPTLESCQQSISGVGGECATDTTSQLPPPLIQGPIFRALDPAYPSPDFRQIDPVPPPPQE